MGIQHLFVKYSPLETCSAGVGGGYCHKVGDVVACIVLFFMNDLWPCGASRKLAVTMSLDRMLLRILVGSARGITQTAWCTGDSTVNTTVPTVSTSKLCISEPGAGWRGRLSQSFSWEVVRQSKQRELRVLRFSLWLLLWFWNSGLKVGY